MMHTLMTTNHKGVVKLIFEKILDKFAKLF